MLKCPTYAHPTTRPAPLEEGDEISTFARIDAQEIRMEMPKCKVDKTDQRR